MSNPKKTIEENGAPKNEPQRSSLPPTPDVRDSHESRTDLGGLIYDVLGDFAEQTGAAFG